MVGWRVKSSISICVFNINESIMDLLGVHYKINCSNFLLLKTTISVPLFTKVVESLKFAPSHTHTSGATQFCTHDLVEKRHTLKSGTHLIGSWSLNSSTSGSGSQILITPL